MAGRLSAGGFVALMLAMMAIIPALKQLTNVQNMLQRGVASAERLFGVLDAPDEVDTGPLTLQRAKGLVEFRNVVARSAGQAEPELDGISFDACRSGERRGGKECVSTCRSRWSPYHEQTKQTRQKKK